MSDNRDWLNPDEWHRVGRGRWRDVIGLDDGDIERIMDALPAEYKPYLLVASYSEKCGRQWTRRLEVVDPREIGDCVSRGIWAYFIVSEALSPAVAKDLSRIDDRTLSLNGTVILQHGVSSASGPQPTSLGHVGDVVNASGEQVSFPGYVRVFESAVKAARRLRKSADSA